MRIAIVHYHLQRGGVTRVIENAIASLDKEQNEILVLSGEPYEGQAIENVSVVEALSYRTESAVQNPKDLAQQCLEATQKKFGTTPDLWHIHNHSLGKNILLPKAIEYLLEQQQRLLLQMHDFAEDGRPQNYQILSESLNTLYPIAPQVHYATLNARDFDYLEKSEIPTEQLHLLANPVLVPNDNSKQPNKETIKKIVAPNCEHLILYPTRAIRRKNLGELALWAALADANTWLATTLAPQNALWIDIHKEWETFIQQNKLNAKLAVVQHNDFPFPDWIQTADALITTSIAEGFGLAFLEPSCFDKPLVGRNLPEITVDFQKAGADLSNLYERLDIPLELINVNELTESLKNTLTSYYKTYQQNLPNDAVDSAYHSIVQNNNVDFGRLDENRQRQIIQKVTNSPNLKKAIQPNTLDKNHTIQQNRKTVEEKFNLDSYGKKLTTTYESIVNSPVEKPQYLDPQKVLTAFLNPKHFNFLRT